MATKTPKEILHRILLVSLIDGWSIALVAGLCTVASLVFGDWVGGFVGLLVTAGGVIELRGRRRLTQHDADGGMDFLVYSQCVVIGVIWAYAISRMTGFDADTAMANMTPDMKSALDQIGMSAHDVVHYVRLFTYALYGTVMFVTLGYQGGMIQYYRHRRAVVREALTAAPEVPVMPPPVPPRPTVGDDVMDA